MIYYVVMFYMILLIIMMFLLFIYLLMNMKSIYLEIEIFNLSSVKFEYLILMDWVSILFINVVLFISMMVMIYSLEYMYSDMMKSRFMMLVMMFIISMLMMILSPNMFSILFGWDGLGLVSYCLVIYYQSKESFNSGMVTVLINRLGDIMILLSLSMMLNYGSWNFMFYTDLNVYICVMLFISSITKSAQIPFSSWLPMAMAAPTPVSSLVHSSTLVTAGVYLLIRLNYLFKSSIMIWLMMMVSLITMFMAGLGANFEFDLKKIIALSTLSQLGVMIFCLSMNLSEVSLFHLLMHAMFKSLLFMCAGVIIHNMLGNQDIRYISMTLINMPLVSVMFNCSSMSLCGIPFMSGFFSKDLILEMYLMSMFNKFNLIILFISMGLTVSYTFRLMYYSFIKGPQLGIYSKYNFMLSNMGVSMYLLFLFSIIMGLTMSWLLFSMKNYIYLTKFFKLFIVIFMMLGGGLSFLLFEIFLKLHLLKYCNLFMKMFMILWFMPLLIESMMFYYFTNLNQFMFNMDMGWLEYLSKSSMILMMKIFFKMENFNKNFMYLMILLMFLMFLLI